MMLYSVKLRDNGQTSEREPSCKAVDQVPCTNYRTSPELPGPQSLSHTRIFHSVNFVKLRDNRQTSERACRAITIVPRTGDSTVVQLAVAAAVHIVNCYNQGTVVDSWHCNAISIDVIVRTIIIRCASMDGRACVCTDDIV